MSTKILVDRTRERFQHSESRRYLKEKYKNQLRIPYAGGMWTIDIPLISFLQQSSKETEILLDEFQNPVLVDRLEFLKLTSSTYEAVMVKWHEEFTELSSKR